MAGKTVEVKVEKTSNGAFVVTYYDWEQGKHMTAHSEIKDTLEAVRSAFMGGDAEITIKHVTAQG